MAGYSPTPLIKKLGLKDGMQAVVLRAPENYMAMLGPDAKFANWVEGTDQTPDFVHMFTDSKEFLKDQLVVLRTSIASNGMIWVSWPKKASKVPTDVTEDTIREVCLPLGLVDVKVCAVDEVWSGLKLVIRKELR